MALAATTPLAHAVATVRVDVVATVVIEHITGIATTTIITLIATETAITHDLAQTSTIVEPNVIEGKIHVDHGKVIEIVPVLATTTETAIDQEPASLRNAAENAKPLLETEIASALRRPHAAEVT